MNISRQKQNPDTRNSKGRYRELLVPSRVTTAKEGQIQWTEEYSERG